MYQLAGRRVRIYDGALTPHYIELSLLDDTFSFDAVPPQATEEFILDGGRVTSHSGYIITDESTTFTFTEVPLRVGIESTARSLLNAFANPFSVSPWTVGADTWTPVLPTEIGTREDSQGNLVTPPVSAIARNVNNLVNLFFKVLAPPDDPGGNAFVIGLLGMGLGGMRVEMEGTRVMGAAAMRHYGGIQYGLADFPDGVETVPN